MKHKNMYYDNHYKYKLNMLEPGLIMMKLIGVLFVTGILLWAAGWHWLSSITLFLAGSVFAVLLILLAIEAHQDKVLNDIALRENIELEKKYGIS
ncbi:hypothetical protein NXH76_05220 [Blautia schinkii]|nr:hypothetical protein [Blautia schinkii]